MRGHAPQHPQAVKHLAPCWAGSFACAAGACPDSCCRAGWEIVIDPETLAKYATLPGEDGDRVRKAAVPAPRGREAGPAPGDSGKPSRDEEVLLRQDENRVCLLLDPDGLCHAQRCFGHESLCRVCREYPRFHREFGALTEHGLSLSCPTAFRLAVETPPGWTEWEDDAPIVPNDLDPERYLLLREGRQLALGLLAREELPFRDRLALVWALAERLQRGLEGEKRTGKAALRRLSSPIGQKAVLQKIARASRFAPDQTRWGGIFGGNTGSLSSLAARFAGLEILSEEWREGLAALQAAEASGRLPPEGAAFCEDAVYARYLWCSLYKYWLDAADDGRLLPRVRRSLAMTLLGRAMDQLVPKDRSWLQRISREIEHCEENLEALLTGL